LICTGTTIVNDIIEQIPHTFKNHAQKIVILDPSSSIIPDILFDRGVDIVGGMKIVDSKKVLTVIEQGGGRKFFKQHGKKYFLKKTPF